MFETCLHGHHRHGAANTVAQPADLHDVVFGNIYHLYVATVDSEMGPYLFECSIYPDQQSLFFANRHILRLRRIVIRIRTKEYKFTEIIVQSLP